MRSDGNAHSADDASVDGLIRTPYTLAACVVCGDEQIQTARQQTSCPQCGSSARRTFALFRALKEER